MTSDCGSLVLKVNGNNTVVEGAIHSNGKLEVNGNNFTAGYTSAGGPNDCEPVINGENIDLGGGSDEPVIDNVLRPWPRYYTKSEFTCTYSAEEFKFNTTGQTIPTGTYCASKLFEANGNNQRGTITVLAPEIKIDGDNQFFRPHQLGVLFFATGSKELILDGNGYDWEGVIFHPGGRIKLNGDSVLRSQGPDRRRRGGDQRQRVRDVRQRAGDGRDRDRARRIGGDLAASPVWGREPEPPAADHPP